MINKKNIALTIGIFIVALIYRIHGLFDSHPFWVDEFSSAHQANLFLRYGASFFTQTDYYVELNKFIPAGLIALSFTFFGQSEWAARLPFVIIGSLVPVAVFFLGKKITNTLTGFLAALLTLFSHFMITWSRQARGYVLTQLLVLITCYCYIQIISKNKHVAYKLGFLASIIIGIFTHQLFIIVLVAIGIHALIHYKSRLHSFFNRYTIILSAVILGLLIASGFFTHLIISVSHQIISMVNNTWYYHSFLWREYTLITFIGIIGFILAFFKNKRDFLLLTIYIVLHCIFIFYIFGPYVSRYLLPIFPFLLIGMAYFLTYLSRLVIQDKKWMFSSALYVAIPTCIVLSIIGNGDKFVKKPLSFYSVDYTFREIALVDYDQIYAIITQKGDIKNQKTAVIDTWADRLAWYMGENYAPSYLFRWEDAGPMKKTNFTRNSKGEKIVTGRKDTKFISNLQDLQNIMKQYPSGFIFIDDTTLPEDVVQYVEKNFKKELFTDHYTLDDNPYSIWPATLYSWGL